MGAPAKTLIEADDYIPEPNTGCWLWLGWIGTGGYGFVRMSGRSKRAHRVMFRQSGRDVPPGLNVLHRCDTRACVNPDHLFLGTHGDNVADMVSKNRQARGRRHRSALFDPDRVRAIRLDPRSPNALAGILGCSPNAIRKIRKRQSWAHVS